RLSRVAARSRPIAACLRLPRRRVRSIFILLLLSSRRRHTRSKRDWSSDVCSSDLGQRLRSKWQVHKKSLVSLPLGRILYLAQLKIGRASCRERGAASVVDVAG